MAISATTSTPSSSPKNDARRRRFEDVFEVIRDEILLHFSEQGVPDNFITWYKENLDYNVPGGKLNRGMSVVDSIEILKGRPLTDDEYFKAAVLGWGVELLQAYFLVTDDLMDRSITRRGQSCYYLIERVGSIAVNDAGMLRSAIFLLLKKYFREDSCYVALIEIFHETIYQTEMGQLIDLTTAPENNVDLSRFSLDKYRLIVRYKTAYYSFYLPIALSMLMCKVPEEYPSSTSTVHPYALAKTILLPLGEYFQIQDDFLDFSGAPEQIGKIGTDIVDNKCSWCINTALSLASPEQTKVLHDNYGRKDKLCEAKVKKVFEEVDLRGRYAAYEESVHDELLTLIEAIPKGEVNEVGPVLKREVFTGFLNKIYKRTK